MEEANGHRLWRLVEARRDVLGVTKREIAEKGGPSPEWIRRLRDTDGTPGQRMSTAMRRLDKALEWPEGTAWHLATADRGGWAAEQLAVEEKEVLHHRRQQISAVQPRENLQDHGLASTGGHQSDTNPKRHPYSDAVAAQIRAERAAGGLTIEQVSEATSLPPSLIVRIEDGTHVVDIAQLVDIASALGLSPRQLIARAEDRMPGELREARCTPSEEGDAGRALQQRYRLTARRAEVAGMVVLGFTNQQVSRRLGISPRTVDTHVSAIYRATGARNRTELAVLARQP